MKVELLNDNDTEILRILTYLIHSNQVFLGGEINGIKFVSEVFQFIGRI